ncbi:MAG: hypothetical protein JWN92_1008, partial [Candidatus Acidoferrum typicum]|nr:hypothetical protein [Candidatus Acidoferrum typicum]
RRTWWLEAESRGCSRRVQISKRTCTGNRSVSVLLRIRCRTLCRRFHHKCERRCVKFLEAADAGGRSRRLSGHARPAECDRHIQCRIQMRLSHAGHQRHDNEKREHGGFDSKRNPERLSNAGGDLVSSSPHRLRPNIGRELMVGSRVLVQFLVFFCLPWTRLFLAGSK